MFGWCLEPVKYWSKIYLKVTLCGVCVCVCAVYTLTFIEFYRQFFRPLANKSLPELES